MNRSAYITEEWFKLRESGSRAVGIRKVELVTLRSTRELVVLGVFLAAMVANLIYFLLFERGSDRFVWFYLLLSTAVLLWLVWRGLLRESFRIHVVRVARRAKLSTTSVFASLDAAEAQGFANAIAMAVSGEPLRSRARSDEAEVRVSTAGLLYGDAQAIITSSAVRFGDRVYDLSHLRLVRVEHEPIDWYWLSRLTLPCLALQWPLSRILGNVLGNEFPGSIITALFQLISIVALVGMMFGFAYTQYVYVVRLSGKYGSLAAFVTLDEAQATAIRKAIKEAIRFHQLTSPAQRAHF